MQSFSEMEAFDDDLYDAEEEDTMKDKYLTFRIGKEIYGIEIYYVIEIVGIQKITGVPDMPDYVKGVINLRGQIIPVMDVRCRFRMAEKEYNDRTCIIVVNMEDTGIGLVVDTVEEVTDIPAQEISPAPKIGKGKRNRYIRGMGKTGDEVKVILDVGKLLFEDDSEILSEIMGGGSGRKNTGSHSTEKDTKDTKEIFYEI
ncbi:MAG: chemotaxis protein CheW [Desulfococcaceae bacterium]|jgi:purine-binding chemotaxis protein CheW|nr:chemotaxis protein CheW [Desulfococcaceae bacterium]